MNERIRELMAEAVTFYFDPDSKQYEAQVCPEDLELFAELIVRECMIRVRSRQQFATEDEQNVTQAFDLLIYDLESLFGVEE